MTNMLAKTPTQSVLPRWRGFNLMELMSSQATEGYHDLDFQWISDFGFDFVRLLINHLCLVEAGTLDQCQEVVLDRIDHAIDLGAKHRIHVNLNLHRAAGYCVYYGKGPFERSNLWKDKEARTHSVTSPTSTATQ